MKKLKLILVMVFVLIIPFGLVGCENNVKEIKEIKEDRFIVVEKYTNTNTNTFYILVDKETKVCYLQSNYWGGLTVLVDENGKPILYEGEI